MIHSVQFSCVLDTNVIYPIDIRDSLFWFAYYELYTPKWSKHIFDEWKDVMIRKGVPEEYLSTFGLKVKGVDDFITDIIDLNQERAIQAFKDLVLNRTNPDLDEFQILDRFRKLGLVDSANYIHSLL